MKKFILVALVTILGTCISTPTDFPAAKFMELVSPQTDYGNANFYIDLVLFNINRQLPDTIALPDIGGPFNLHNCVFYGLEDKIKRDGDATLVVSGTSARFVMALRMLNVGMSCDWKYLLMRGSASGTTAKVSLSAGLAWLLEHGQHPYLTEFRVTTLEPITTDVTGATGFNWLVEDIADAILASVEDEIIYVIEHQVRDIFQGILDTMVIP